MTSQQKEPSPLSGRKLWLWVIIAFMVLITAWTTLIIIAARNQPELIEIEHQED
jgi:hypothetical protein